MLRVERPSRSNRNFHFITRAGIRHNRSNPHHRYKKPHPYLQHDRDNRNHVADNEKIPAADTLAAWIQ